MIVMQRLSRAQRLTRYEAVIHRRKMSALPGPALRVATGAAKRVFLNDVNEEFMRESELWLGASYVDEPTVSILDPDSHYLDLVSACSRETLDLGIDLTNAPDPFDLVGEDIRSLSSAINNLLGSDHAVLDAVAKYFFEHDGGKKIRPTMILLISRALAINDDRPSEVYHAAQLRLSEITEMIHTASLLHDDVIDEADTRRNCPSVNSVFGSKLAILAGDFLLARASISLARLRNVEVVEIMSTAIENLVKGEVMQMKSSECHFAGVSPIEYYLRKNYYKTGSLMANSCRATAVLGGHSKSLCKLAFSYGKHIGNAFQLVDDALDYEGLNTGKPLLADLKAGIATAPILLAQDEYPQLKTLVQRKFSLPGDVEEAAELVQKSSGLQRTKELALAQARLACETVVRMKYSLERDALVKLAHSIITRSE